MDGSIHRRWKEGDGGGTDHLTSQPKGERASEHLLRATHEAQESACDTDEGGGKLDCCGDNNTGGGDGENSGDSGTGDEEEVNSGGDRVV